MSIFLDADLFSLLGNRISSTETANEFSTKPCPAIVTECLKINKANDLILISYAWGKCFVCVLFFFFFLSWLIVPFISFLATVHSCAFTERERDLICC